MFLKPSKDPVNYSLSPIALSSIESLFKWDIPLLGHRVLEVALEIPFLPIQIFFMFLGWKWSLFYSDFFQHSSECSICLLWGACLFQSSLFQGHRCISPSLLCCSPLMWRGCHFSHFLHIGKQIPTCQWLLKPQNDATSAAARSIPCY